MGSTLSRRANEHFALSGDGLTSFEQIRSHHRKAENLRMDVQARWAANGVERMQKSIPYCHLAQIRTAAMANAWTCVALTNERGAYFDKAYFEDNLSTMTGEI